MESPTVRILLLVNIFLLTCCHAANAKNIRDSSGGSRIEATPTNSNTTLVPKTDEHDAHKMEPPVDSVAAAHSVEPAVLNASVDALKQLTELAESGAGVGVDDTKVSNSSTNNLNSQSGDQDLQVAGSELLRIESRSLNSYPTDYHRPIYDYNDHGDYKDGQDSPSDESSRDGHSHPFKGSSSTGYHDDHGHTSNYEHGHDSEHGHDAALGHSGTKGHSDNRHGAHETNHEEGGHSLGADYIAGHTDDGSYGGGSSGGALSEAGHNAGSKGHVNKGHSDDGFDTVHHKEEYGYSESFGDDEDLSKYHDSLEHFDEFHDANDGKNFFGSSFMDDHSHDHFGTSGDHTRGEYHDSNEDTSSSYGHEGDIGHKTSYGEHGSSVHGGQHHDTPTHYDPDFGHLRSSYDDDHHDHDDVQHDDLFPHSSAQASIDAKFDSLIPQSFSSVDPGLLSDIPKREVGLYESAVGDYGYHDPLFRDDVTGPVER